MKHVTIAKEMFVENRKNLAKLLKPGSIAIFHSNDTMPTNADGTMRFRQNNDLFYLSGVDQEETVLVMAPDFPDSKYREMLFVRETSEQIATWEGHKLSQAQATELSGIQTVYWTDRFLPMLQILFPECENIYLNTNEHSRALVEVQTRNARFVAYCKQHFPLHTYLRAAPLMQQLRTIKSATEIGLLQEACDLTELGFRRILPFVKPGVMEYEIEAELAHEFMRAGAGFAGYQPIIASGANTCVLHYTENSRACHNGDLLLMDFAAGHANYNADLTRTIPVNGRFSPRQRQVYDAVLRVMKAASEMLVTGNLWDEYQKEAGKIMEGELIDLGLLDRHDVARQDAENPLYKQYFMHGTSHHLGLDVHDVGSRYRRFEPGMVFTCEPGIYIRDENLGIRLEDNIVITETGNRDLMATIPVEVGEIEELMNAGK